MKGKNVGKRGASAAILEHLKTKGSITSMEAYDLYGVTRLASIIFSLRHKYDIDTLMQETKTRFGETCQYAEYIYIGEL